MTSTTTRPFPERSSRLPPPLPDFTAPRWNDVFAHWELLATYFGSLSEKHLRAYLDELAFRVNRRLRAIEESFLLLAPALAESTPRPYRSIVAKPEPAGHALSIYETLRKRARSGSKARTSVAASLPPSMT